MTPKLQVVQYDPSQAEGWDSFVRSSKNGTFLHERPFMDYHADRFVDHSLVVRQDDRIVALLPANASGTALVSHGGLTYGGFVTDNRMRADLMIEVINATTSYLREAGFISLRYKPVPHFYHRLPAEEDIYALFRVGAHVLRVDAASAMRIADRPAMSKLRQRSIKTARNLGVIVRETDDWSAGWTLIEAVLAERHGVKPTHSLWEIKLLADRFPEQIRLFGAFLDGNMISAMVIFDCGTNVHVQYIASSDQGREAGGVDIIVDFLLSDVYSDAMWFDFGISTEDMGRTLNVGLSRQKEMFGARTVIYQQLELIL